MFKRIFVLIVVLFISMSCKQSTAPILSVPTTDDNGTIDGDNSNGGNTDNGNTDSGLGYGVYNVYVLENDKIETIPLRISDTYEMLGIYSSMIIDSSTGKSKFELHRVNTSSTTGDTYYTFNTNNLNIMKIEVSKEGSENTDGNENPDGSETVKETIAKKFRGVCLVRIYPDAAEKPTNSSLLGDYTIAGIYTEVIPPSSKLISFMAMTNSNEFQNYGYDELIILRPDITNVKLPTTGYANEDTEVNYTNYRADILFNIDKTINLYYYNPNRAFENQNTNYIFKRVKTTQQ